MIFRSFVVFCFRLMFIIFGGLCWIYQVLLCRSIQSRCARIVQAEGQWFLRSSQIFYIMLLSNFMFYISRLRLHSINFQFTIFEPCLRKFVTNFQISCPCSLLFMHSLSSCSFMRFFNICLSVRSAVVGFSVIAAVFTDVFCLIRDFLSAFLLSWIYMALITITLCRFNTFPYVVHSNCICHFNLPGPPSSLGTYGPRQLLVGAFYKLSYVFGSYDLVVSFRLMYS